MEIKALIEIDQFATTFSPIDFYRFSSQLNNFIDIDRMQKWLPDKYYFV